MRQSQQLVLLALALAMLGTAPAAATPTWLPAEKSFGATPATSASSAAVTAPDGTVALGKIASDGTIQVRTRSPGGGLSNVVDLDGPSATSLRLVAGADGTFAAVWARAGETYASVRPPGGAFSSPREAAPQGVGLESDQLGLDGQGRLWIVYVQTAAPGSVTAASLPPGNGAAGSFPLFSPAPGQMVFKPSLAVEPGGGVHVIYLLNSAETHNTTTCFRDTEIRGLDGTSGGFADAGVLIRRTQTSPWVSGPDYCDIPDGGTSVDSEHLAVSATGDLTALFVITEGSGFSTSTAARHRDPGAAWPALESAPETVSSQGDTPAIAYAGSTPVAAVVRNGPVEALTARAADGAWAAPAPVSGADGGLAPILSGSPGGWTVLAFQEYLGQHRYQALVRAPDGSLSPLVAISSPAQDLFAPGSAGVDGQGNAVVGWTRKGADTSGAYHAEFAGFDGAGPRLDGLTVPATGAIGSPLAFSVSPVDVWSSVASVGWAFGDGAAGDGASVSHAYAAGGDFAASVTATDSLGNASTASKAVSVPVPPPPAKDTTKPKFQGKVKVKPSKVKRGKKATITYSLSEPAKLKATAVRLAKGVKKGKRCVAPRRKRKRGEKRCTRKIAVGSFNGTAAKAGAGKLTLPAKLKRKKLAKGKYTVTLVATDAAGNRSKPASASFTVK